MTPILAPDYGTNHPSSPRAVERADARTLAQQFSDRVIELSRTVPRGVRAPQAVQLAKDMARGKVRCDLVNCFRLALAMVKAGHEAALYGEAFADVLGACAATVLPISDASLAECLAESHADPKQCLADRPDATPQQLLDAARAMEEEARAATAAARSYRRAYRAALRGRAGQGWSAWESRA